jgi:hypothetical protein
MGMFTPTSRKSQREQHEILLCSIPWRLLSRRRNPSRRPNRGVKERSNSTRSEEGNDAESAEQA